jgi:hypothetical protein
VKLPIFAASCGIVDWNDCLLAYHARMADKEQIDSQNVDVIVDISSDSEARTRWEIVGMLSS